MDTSLSPPGFTGSLARFGGEQHRFRPRCRFQGAAARQVNEWETLGPSRVSFVGSGPHVTALGGTVVFSLRGRGKHNGLPPFAA